MSSFQVLCADTPELRKAVYRFRYDVYVKQLGRRQACANHQVCEIEEPLDDEGWNFVGISGGKVVASVRGNRFSDRGASYYRRFYRFDFFKHLSPFETLFTTKLMVAPEHRGGPYAARLLHHFAAEGFSRGIRTNFIDCNKPLVDLFERMGYFSYCGWSFHKEFGTVRPMVMAADTVTYLHELKSILGRAAAKHFIDGQFDGYELIARHGEIPRNCEVAAIAKQHFKFGMTACAL